MNFFPQWFEIENSLGAGQSLFPGRVMSVVMKQMDFETSKLFAIDLEKFLLSDGILEFIGHQAESVGILPKPSG